MMDIPKSRQFLPQIWIRVPIFWVVGFTWTGLVRMDYGDELQRYRQPAAVMAGGFTFKLETRMTTHEFNMATGNAKTSKLCDAMVY